MCKTRYNQNVSTVPDDIFVTLKPWLWWDYHRQRRIHIKNLAGFCKIPEDLQLSNSCKEIFLAKFREHIFEALSLAFDAKNEYISISRGGVRRILSSIPQRRILKDKRPSAGSRLR
jgi:hypothetical protein